MSNISQKDLAGAPIDVTGNMIKVLFACSGNLDLVGDIMADTALAGATPPVPLMWRHYLDQLPLGNVERIERREKSDLPSDVRASFPDVTGGWVAHARVYRTERGKELIDMLNDGFIGGASFGYKVNRARAGKTKSGKAGRVLEDVALYEVSVLEPGGQANPAAMTIKSFALEQLQRKAEMDRVLAEVKAILREDDMRKLREKMRRNAQLAEIDAWWRSLNTGAVDVVLRDAGRMLGR